MSPLRRRAPSAGRPFPCHGSGRLPVVPGAEGLPPLRAAGAAAAAPHPVPFSSCPSSFSSSSGPSSFFLLLLRPFLPAGSSGQGSPAVPSRCLGGWCVSTCPFCLGSDCCSCSPAPNYRIAKTLKLGGGLFRTAAWGEGTRVRFAWALRTGAGPGAGAVCPWAAAAPSPTVASPGHVWHVRLLDPSQVLLPASSETRARCLIVVVFLGR